MIVMFLSAEIMLQGVSLSLVAWSRFHNDFGGQMLVLFIIAVAACEAAVALALVVTLFRRRGKLDVAAWHVLREANQPPPPTTRRCRKSPPIRPSRGPTWRRPACSPKRPERKLTTDRECNYQCRMMNDERRKNMTRHAVFVIHHSSFIIFPHA